MIHEKTGNVYPVMYYGGNEDVHCTVLAQNIHDDEVKGEQNLTLTVSWMALNYTTFQWGQTLKTKSENLNFKLDKHLHIPTFSRS